MDALQEVFKRLDSVHKTEQDLDIVQLLLLDIARSLRVQTELAKAGMEFSHSLADKFD